MLTDAIINSTEEKIRSYYRNLDEIERLECKLKLLQKQRDEVETDINSSNITLVCTMQGINYDSVKVQTSSTIAPQEKALEKAFDRLEKQLEKINCEMIETKILKRDLEKKNSDIAFIVDKLSNEAKKFIDLKYSEKKSYKKIGALLHISEPSVGRLRAEVLANISRWICVYF